MKNRVLNLISLVFNAIIVALVAYSISTFFAFGGKGNMEVIGIQCFQYFTVLSNVLAALVSLIFLFFNIKSLRKGIQAIPSKVLLLKLIGTVAVMVTFMTVMLFLGPTMGYKAMFAGVNLLLHAIVPLLSIVSFGVFELSGKLKTKDSLYGLIPTALYSVVYVIMVVFVKGWKDFYGFTFGGKLYMAPISFIMMYIATMIFSLGLVSLHNFMYQKGIKH